MSAAKRQELEAARLRRKHVHQSPPILFAGSNAEGIAPVGECLACGHIMKLAVWKDAPWSEVTHGLCGPCRDAAMHLRGACSTERGCLCESMAESVDKRSKMIADEARRARLALAREEAGA